MLTATKLKNITDRGKFEIIATTILAIESPQYKSIIQLGINAKGETIKAPNDGFSKIPNTNHYLFLQHTTTERKKLKSKWLSNNINDLGDLEKAKISSQTVKQYDSSAIFTVILTTNETVDEALLNSVYEFCKNNNFFVEIYELTRIVRFLDSTPQGHWIRKEYLGVEAEMLSKSLLLFLSKKSLDQYEAEFLFNKQDITDRKEYLQLANNFRENTTISYLLGDSGKGKTTIAYSFMKEHFTSGTPVFWLSETLLSSSTSLESVLNKHLKEMHPMLMDNSIESLENILKENEKIIITIDDLSHLNNPSEMLDRLESWTKHNSNIIKYLFIICPLKPWTVIGSDKFAKVRATQNVIFINNFTPDEAIEAVSKLIKKNKIEIKKYELIKLCNLLNNDPLLIGLFESSLESNRQQDLMQNTNDTISQYIDSKIDKYSQSKKVPRQKILQSLYSLSKKMLENLNFHPNISQLNEWLCSSIADILLDLSFFEDIIYISKYTDKLDFKHDRLREFFLSNEIYTQICSNNLSNDFFNDPYFASLIGLALTKLPSSTDDMIILEKSPLSLLIAIKNLPTNSERKIIFSNLLCDFIDKIDQYSFPKRSLLNQFLNASFDLDCEESLPFIRKLPLSIHTNLALIRNGDINGAFRYCLMFREFTPQINDSWRDEAFEIGFYKYPKNIKKSLISRLKTVTDQRAKQAILDVAGYFPFPELNEHLMTFWENLDDKNELFLHFFWAVLKSFPQNNSNLIEKALDYWLTIPNEMDGENRSQRNILTEELQFAISRGIPEENLKAILKWSQLNPDFKHDIACIFQNCDQPRVIEFIARYCGEIRERLQGTNNFSPFLLHLSGIWDRRKPRNKQMSQASKQALYNIWSNTNEEIFVQEASYRIWTSVCDENDLTLLQNEKKDSIHYNNSLINRAKLSDYTVTDEFLTLLESRYSLFPTLAKIWSQKTKTYLFDKLEKLTLVNEKDISYSIAKLLRDIPAFDAEDIITKLWDKVRHISDFVQIALYIGSKNLLELADESIKEDTSLLIHVGMNFGFKTNGLQERIKKQHILCLIPYVNSLGQMEILELAEQCRNFGLTDLANEKIIPLLNSEFRHHFPDDEYIINELNEVLKDQTFNGRRYRIEDYLINRNDPISSFSILENWLNSNCSKEAFEIAAMYIENKGKRSDLNYLLYAKAKIGPAVDEVFENTKFTVFSRSLD